MKEKLQLIIELLRFGRQIYDVYKKEKNAKRRKSIEKAIKNGDLVRLTVLILGR